MGLDQGRGGGREGKPIWTRAGEGEGQGRGEGRGEGRTTSGHLNPSDISTRVQRDGAGEGRGKKTPTPWAIFNVGASSCIRCPMLSGALAYLCCTAEPAIRCGVHWRRPRRKRDLFRVRAQTAPVNRYPQPPPPTTHHDRGRGETQEQLPVHAASPPPPHCPSRHVPLPSPLFPLEPARDGCTSGREEVTSRESCISVAEYGSTGANRAIVPQDRMGQGRTDLTWRASTGRGGELS